MGGQLLDDAGMFTSGGILAKPAGEDGKLIHVASHELSWQHAGIYGLGTYTHTPTHIYEQSDESLQPQHMTVCVSTD